LWSLDREPRRFFNLEESDREIPVQARFSADGELCAFVTHGSAAGDLGGKVVVVDSHGASTEPRQFGAANDAWLIFDCSVSNQTETMAYLPGFCIGEMSGAIISAPLVDSTKPRQKRAK
jgi:hypothetical protein